MAALMSGRASAQGACSAPVDAVVTCHGALPGGVKHQPARDLTLVIAADALVDGTVQLGGISSPDGMRRVWSGDGVLALEVRRGAEIRNPQGDAVLVASRGSANVAIDGRVEAQLVGVRTYVDSGPGDVRLGGRIEAGQIGAQLITFSGGGRLSNTGVIVTRDADGGGMFAYAHGAPAGSSAVVVENSGTITSLGANSGGISAYSGFPSVGLRVVNTGQVEAGIRGIYASGGPGNLFEVENSGSVATRSQRGIAIDLDSTFGGIQARNSGQVEAAGDDSRGIRLMGDIANEQDYALRPRSYRLENAGSVRTDGDRAIAVSMASNFGDLAFVSSGQVRTRGAAAHAVQISAGTGDVDVRVGGEITTAGAGANAIEASSEDGRVRLALGGQISAAGAAGLAGGRVVEATVEAKAKVRGGTAGLDLTSVEGSRLEVHGELNGGGGPAIVARGGALNLLVSESGSITGGLQLSAADDRVASSGRLRLGASDFGAGDDRILNAGVLGPAAHAVRIEGLEVLENRGIIDLADGRAGTVLDLGQALVQAGPSSMLRLEAATGAGDALAVDQLVAGTFAGQTSVEVLALGVVPLGARATFARGALGPSTFVVGADANRGLVGFAVDVHETSAEIVTGPGEAAFGAAHLAGFSAAPTRHVRDLVWARTEQAPAAPGWRTWLTGASGAFETGVQTYQAEADGKLFTGRVAGRERWDAVAGGVEAQGADWLAGLGVAHTEAELRYGGLAKGDIRSLHALAYLRREGSLGFLAAQVRAGRLKLEIEATPEDADSVHRWIWGADLQLGRRFGGDGGYIEPNIGLGWTALEDAPLRFDTALLTLPSDAWVTAQAGTRFGRSWSARKVRLDLSGGVAAVHEEGLGSRVRLASGDEEVAFASRWASRFVRLDVRAAYAMGPLRVHVGVQQDVAGGRRGDGLSGNAGLAVRW
jgi:hypothetical protein